MTTGNKIKGYLYGVLAAAFYGMNPLFALPLYADGMSTSSVLLLRYLLAIPSVALLMVMRGHNFKLERSVILPVAILGLLMGFSSFALFESYNHMAAGIASTLLFVYPLMVALIGSLVFKEKLTMLTGICLAMAMAGIALLYAGNPGGELSGTGTLLVMLSSLSYAIYIVAVNRGKIKEIPTLKLTLYVLTFGSMIFAVQLMSSGKHLDMPSSALTWCSLFGLALLPTAASLIFTTLAIQNIGSTPTAILGVFEPVTALIFGVLVFHELITPTDYAGMLLILAAVCMVIAGNSITDKLNRIRKLFPRIKKQ